MLQNKKNLKSPKSIIHIPVQVPSSRVQSHDIQQAMLIINMPHYIAHSNLIQSWALRCSLQETRKFLSFVSWYQLRGIPQCQNLQQNTYSRYILLLDRYKIFCEIIEKTHRLIHTKHCRKWQFHCQWMLIDGARICRKRFCQLHQISYWRKERGDIC